MSKNDLLDLLHAALDETPTTETTVIKCLDKAIDAAAQLQAELDKRRWIPVSEPPEKAQLILAKHKGGNFFVLQHNPKYHTDGLKKDYTHYREIILPKGETE